MAEDPKGNKKNQGVSKALGSTSCVNFCCHNFTGQLPANDKHLIWAPHIVPVMWGHYYALNPAAVTALVKLLTDLVTGPFMNGLSQYGVRRGTVLNACVIDIIPPNTGPANVDGHTTFPQLQEWLNAGKVFPRPGDEGFSPAQLLYVIFVPTETMTDNNTDCGFHNSEKFNPAMVENDLIYAVIGANGPWVKTTSTATAFANSVAFCVGHELVEAFTNRDGHGYFLNVECTCNGQSQPDTCEIGDICEQRGTNPCCTTFKYKGWNVEPYWSNWDNACINGDQPVSVRKFLQAIGVDGSLGLRQIAAVALWKKINVDVVARIISPDTFGPGDIP
jgi:hypothetical protein